jgi:hypothetical protein
LETLLLKKTQELFHGMRFSDFLFVLVLLANISVVVYLGIGNYHRASKVGESLKNGESILAWFNAIPNDPHSENLSDKNFCSALKEGQTSNVGKANTWRECLDSIFSSHGPFHGYTNLLMPESPIYAGQCNKHDLGTSGAFIFELLTLNPAGPPQTSQMEGDQKLIGDMHVRLSLCDTGYYLVKIGEFKL